MFNKIIANSLPLMPKKFVWLFSKRYIAGETIDENIAISKKLNNSGILVTVDLLGEFIHTIDEAEINKNEYLGIVRRFTREKILGNFSIKPTSFGLLIDAEKCYEFVREVIVEAAKQNNFVRIDMEDSTCTSIEIALFERLKTEFPTNVGIVFQSYLKRTFSDIENLVVRTHKPESSLNIRLCKGIYVEPPELAYTNFHEVRHHFLKDLELMFQQGVYVGIATHDQFLVKEAFELINKYKVAKDKYEFQMLYGVTPSLRDSIVADGHKMRIYVPYGKDWFGYCSRRIKENPKMVTDIVKAVFIKG
ncbi:MAG: proline dehydrogenase family protein [Prolixibacteraceae bacterium]|jgi:proline dehydrogenase|nr:proline dehydrogenase family protein [Prolixibacteraceae bacterium]